MLSRSLQRRAAAEPVGSRWKFSPGAAAHQALWLFAVQPGSDGGGLSDPFDAARQSLDFRTTGWPRDAQGPQLHGALHKRQEELAAGKRRDVRRSMADAAKQLILCRPCF